MDILDQISTDYFRAEKDAIGRTSSYVSFRLKSVIGRKFK